jgi:hypothetical protein
MAHHPASAIDEAGVAQVQAVLRRRILRAFVGRGLIEKADAKDMLGYQHSEPGSDKRGAEVDELHLTPLELIERIAALVPPPRTHRHRYFGVLAPNSPRRAAVTALAQDAAVQPATAQAQAEPVSTCDGVGDGALGVGNALPTRAEPAQPVPPKRPAHYLWAVLIARIYEVFPLLCPLCGGQMHLIAFITEGMQIRKILDHIGVELRTSANFPGARATAVG